DGGDVAADVLHHVVDRHARIRKAPRRVDVERDVLVWLVAGEVEDLGDQQVGDLVVDLLAEEHDPLLQEQREDVERPVAARGLVDDGRYHGAERSHRSSFVGRLRISSVRYTT